jgi:hypothetical protein
LDLANWATPQMVVGRESARVDSGAARLKRRATLQNTIEMHA